MEPRALVIVSVKVIAALTPSPLLDGPEARSRQDAGAPSVAETMTKAEPRNAMESDRISWFFGCVAPSPSHQAAFMVAEMMSGRYAAHS